MSNIKKQSAVHLRETQWFEKKMLCIFLKNRLIRDINFYYTTNLKIPNFLKVIYNKMQANVYDTISAPKILRVISL